MNEEYDEIDNREDFWNDYWNQFERGEFSELNYPQTVQLVKGLVAMAVIYELLKPRDKDLECQIKRMNQRDSRNSSQRHRVMEMVKVPFKKGWKLLFP